VAAVDRGDPFIRLQVLDHGGQPPFVERHGVLNSKRYVFSG
jgi:hypothetical protein